jgi:hypothetical protein
MPSGFQNAVDQLQAEMYKVIVDMSNTTYYPTADGNDNGGVTPNSWDAFTTPPSTFVLGKARARGNIRFRNIVNRLQALGDCQIRDITMDNAASGNTEATADTQSTTLQFTVLFERPLFAALTGSAIGASTVGNDINGATMDTTAKVVRNAIAQGIRDTTTSQARVYNPAVGVGGTQQSISVTTTGATIAQTMGTVSVTQIDESTLFN